MSIFESSPSGNFECGFVYPLLEGWMSNRFWGWLMQAIDRGIFTDAQRLTDYLNKAGFEQTDIRLIPNSMNSLYLITATKG